MRFLIVGLGSMGKRRLRLLRQYSLQCEIVGVDNNEKRRNDVNKEFQIDTFPTIAEAAQKNRFEGAFVCASPKAHFAIMSELIALGIDTFSEINLMANGYEEYIANKNQKLFLSSTFLYRKDIEWIINRVNNSKVNYIYHVGQYLPDWHPWESYNDFFVADKETNGCRELMAIELPWIVKCFGKVIDMHVVKDKISELQIDYPDNYMISFTHENGSKGTVFLDVVSRQAIRSLEIFNENLHVFWDGTPKSLQELSLDDKKMVDISTYASVENDNRYADNIIENAYYDEIDAFINWIKGNDKKVKYSYEEDIKILSLIDEIEG